MGPNPKPLTEMRAPAPKLSEPEPNDGLGVILHAYALVQTPNGHIAVHLEGVTAKSVQYLEPNGRSELRRLASARVSNQIDKRKSWGAP